ncbi:hypothetical protein ACRXB1_26230, partial [Caballeronia sp. M23-90]
MSNSTAPAVIRRADYTPPAFLVSIYRAAKRTGRTLVIDLYAAAVLEATGNTDLPQSHWDGVAL